MAPGGDLQRQPGEGGRAVPAQGLEVYLEGPIQTRKWTDQSGVEKFSTESYCRSSAVS